MQRCAIEPSAQALSSVPEQEEAKEQEEEEFDFARMIPGTWRRIY